MKKENLTTVIALLIVLILLVSGIVLVKNASGVSPPFTVIESNIFYPTPRYEDHVNYPLTLADDEVFVLADSRNGGTDSRYFGPVKKSEILGSVVLIVRRTNL